MDIEIINLSIKINGKKLIIFSILYKNKMGKIYYLYSSLLGNSFFYGGWRFFKSLKVFLEVYG